MNLLYRALIALAFAVLALAEPAFAQDTFPTPIQGKPVIGTADMCLNSSGQMVPWFSAAGAWQCAGTITVSGTFSASLAGWQPTPSYSQLGFSDAVSHAVAVPTGADDIIQNTSANAAYCNVGATPTATSADILVPASSSVPLHNGGAFAQIACISPSSTLAINIAGGTGLWTGTGGGGSGGGGSFTWPGTATTGAANATTAGTMPWVNAYISGTLPAFASTPTFNLGTLNGAATAANQTTANTSLASIATNTTGAATAANQTTGNSSLATIATNTTGLATSANQTNGSQKSQLVDSGGSNLGTSGNPVYVNCSTCGGGGGGGSSGAGGSVPQTTSGAAINVTTLGTSIVIPNTSGEYTYITGYDFILSGAATANQTLTLEYGTGSTCGTGTTVIWGPVTLFASSTQSSNAGEVKGGGFGAVFTPIPQGNDVCLVASASQQIGGSISYTQNANAISSFGGGGMAPFATSQGYLDVASVTSTVANSALPTNGGTLVAYNYGTVPLGLKFSSSGTAAGTWGTTDVIISASGCQIVSPGSFTNVNYLTQSGTASLHMVGGAGAQIGCGGGGGSSSNASVGTNSASIPGSSTLVAGSVAGVLTPAAMTAGGIFKVDASSAAITVSNAASGATGSSVPSSAAYLGANNGGTLTGLTSTSGGNLHADLSSEGGTAVTSTPSAYGTAPSGNVIGVNAYVTNTNANGQATSANSAPVVIASDQSAVAVKAAGGAIADLYSSSPPTPYNGVGAATAIGEFEAMRNEISQGSKSAGGSAAAQSIQIEGIVTSHVVSSALEASHVIKGSSGYLGAYNCTAITGGSAGYCLVINATSAPTTGSAVAPLDFCYFDTTARGCSFSRIPNTIAYSIGITILISTNASPFVFTSGTDTGVIEADAN